MYRVPGLIKLRIIIKMKSQPLDITNYWPSSKI